MPRRNAPAIKPVVDKAWFKEKMAARGLSLRETAARMNFAHASALARRLQGELNTTPNEANDLADLLGVPIREVLFRLGVDLVLDPDSSVPVTGVVDPKGNITTKGSTRLRRAPRPANSIADIFALKVSTGQGQRMDGWHLYYEVAMGVAPEAVGQLAIGEDPAGKLHLGWLQKGAERGRWAMALLDDAAKVRTPELMLRWASPVTWIRCG